MAAVLGSVLTFVIINEIQEGGTPPDGNDTLTTEQLTTALLAPSELPPGYQGQGVASERVSDCRRADAAATILGDSGRTAGPTGITYRKSTDSTDKDDITLAREDLASYASKQDAAMAITRFREWITKCGTVATPSSGDTRIDVTELQFEHYGETTVAAWGVVRYTTLTPNPGGPLEMRPVDATQRWIVVVVQLRSTVCVLGFESASVLVDEGPSKLPALGDVKTLVTTAINKLAAVDGR